MASHFTLKVKTKKKIVDFAVTTDDGYRATYKGSGTGNLKLSSGLFSGYTLKARMKSGVSTLSFVVYDSNGSAYGAGAVSEGSESVVQL